VKKLRSFSDFERAKIGPNQPRISGTRRGRRAIVWTCSADGGSRAAPVVDEPGVRNRSPDGESARTRPAVTPSINWSPAGMSIVIVR